MTSHPRVTVGLPVYNGEDFLEAAIDSILTQSLEDFELIISDNASTDGTQAICRAAAKRDDRVEYLRSDTNRGAAWNHNRTIEAGRAQYFKWMHADDVCGTEFLDRCVDVLEMQHDAVLAHPWTVYIDEQGAELEKYGLRLDADDNRAAFRFRELVIRRHACFEMFGVIRTDLLRTTNGLGGFKSSDRVLLADLSLRGKFVEIPEFLHRHREHFGRSQYANVTQEQMDAWYDPAKAEGFSLPRWRLLREYAKIVQRAPLSPTERYRCYGTLLHWSRINGRPLLGDAKRACRHSAAVAVRRRAQGRFPDA